jgi:hypothetical protein
MSQRTLPDPRVFAQQHDHPLARLASADDPEALVAAVHNALRAGHDNEIAAALEAATSPESYRRLREALACALEPPDAEGDAVVTRLFAVPVLAVTGGVAGARVSAVLPAIERVRALFEAQGALGQARNFGLANVLCDAGALERVSLSRLYRLARGAEPNLAALDLPPADIVTASADEEVHLRFLAGAAVTPAHAPSFLETAADIGAWGMPLTRQLAEQLRVDGVSILPIPRPPARLFDAPLLGRQAREELAFQVFVSRVLRRFRSRTGDPRAVIASLSPAEVGIRLSSPFDPGHAEIFRWRLTPLDRIEQVQGSILDLLRECRLADVTVAESVLTPEQFATQPASDTLQ